MPSQETPGPPQQFEIAADIGVMPGLGRRRGGSFSLPSAGLLLRRIARHFPQRSAEQPSLHAGPHLLLLVLSPNTICYECAEVELLRPLRAVTRLMMLAQAKRQEAVRLVGKP